MHKRAQVHGSRSAGRRPYLCLSVRECARASQLLCRLLSAANAGPVPKLCRTCASCALICLRAGRGSAHAQCEPKARRRASRRGRKADKVQARICQMRTE